MWSTFQVKMSTTIRKPPTEVTIEADRTYADLYFDFKGEDPYAPGSTITVWREGSKPCDLILDGRLGSPVGDTVIVFQVCARAWSL